MLTFTVVFQEVFIRGSYLVLTYPRLACNPAHQIHMVNILAICFFYFKKDQKLILP